MVFVILVGLCAAQAVSTTESNAQYKESVISLADLTKFVGKYAAYDFDKNENVIKGNSLTDDKAFRQVLLKALGNKRFKEFMDELLSMTSPVEQKGQILFFNVAQVHNTVFFMQLSLLIYLIIPLKLIGILPGMNQIIGFRPKSNLAL